MFAGAFQGRFCFGGKIGQASDRQFGFACRDIDTASEMPAEPGSIGSQLSEEENAALTSRIIPAGADEVTISNSATGIGARWLNFENRLRQRRRDIVSSCTSCTVGPASDRAAESAEQERKAI